MIKLKDFSEQNLSINWKTIYVGWEGPGKFLRQLNEKDIIDFAIELVSKDDDQSEDVWTLAGLNERSCDDINMIVKMLSGNEKGGWENELRKWRVLLINETVNKLNSDPLYDLISLTEVWEKFGYPMDCPYSVQGLNNATNPQEYYTLENLKKIIHSHRVWIETELKALKESEV